MFKISHEVPLGLLEKSIEFNDYDYALVHLFDRYPEYLDFYKERVAQGRTVILDNSAYELGRPYETIEYKRWIRKLKPTEYILPDYRDDAKKNLAAIKSWHYSGPGIKIGVVHGESKGEYIQNYLDIKPLVDKIAFSFESFFIEYAEDHSISLAGARIDILAELESRDIIDKKKPHHILGALSPTEYKAYLEYDWIESVDTSNPILHGLLEERYEAYFGKKEKSKIKMQELMSTMITKEMFDTVMYNVKWFRDNLSTPYLEGEIIPDFSISLPSLATKAKKLDKDIVADHYRHFPIETITLMERIWGFEKTKLWCQMTAFKYRMRLGVKESSTIDKDIGKEKWYLDRAASY